MAKIGYIMAAAHYDKLEEDRQWMQEYGCVKIVVENDADEKSRQLWKQLMIALERGDELVISKGSVMMPHPNELSEPATGFYCGNDSNAKDAVREILHDFGWTDTFDMGDISMSRYTEMLGAFWVPVFGQLNTMHWGFRLVR